MNSDKEEKLLTRSEVDKEFHKILKDFNCIRCGWCCTHFNLNINPNLPHHKQLREDLLAAFKRALGIELSIPLGPTQIHQYGFCKDYDPKTKKCKIYLDRPKICRKFFCLRELVPFTFMQIGKVAFENAKGDQKKFTEIINRLLNFYHSKVDISFREVMEDKKRKSSFKEKIKGIFKQRKENKNADL